MKKHAFCEHAGVFICVEIIINGLKIKKKFPYVRIF